LEALAPKLPDMLEGMRSSVAVEAGNLRSTDRPTEAADLKFSGRVFIYHEVPLFVNDQDALRALWANNGMAPQFRGRDYAFRLANPTL
jgi:hypothetical protein